MQLNLNNLLFFTFLFFYSYSLKIDSKLSLNQVAVTATTPTSIIAAMPTVCTTTRLKLPNTDFIYKGYDVFFGDLTPRDGDIDPGFQAPIFQTTFNQVRTSSDMRYDIPDGLHLNRVEGCSISMTSTVITGEESYQKSFSNDLSVVGTIKGVKFGASVSYQQVSEETTKNKNAFIYSKADCKVYMGQIDAYDPPLFHKSFLKALQILNSKKVPFKENQNLYWAFIRNFGTHYIEEVKMGARLGAMSKTTQNEISKMNSNKVSVGTSIGFKDIIGVNNTFTTENTQKSNFMKQMDEVKVFSIGAKPDSKNDAFAWSAKVIDEPMPISYKVRPITEVLKNEELFFDLNQLKDYDLPFLIKNLDEAYDNYCENYLLPNDIVRSCSKINKDADLQQIAKVKINPGEFYILKNALTKTCLTFPDKNEKNMIAYDCDESNLQNVLFSYFDAKWKLTMNGYVGCADLYNGNNDENGKILRWHCNYNNQNQHFFISESPYGTYTIKTFRGKCLSVQDDSKSNYIPIVQGTCHGGPGQDWIPIKSESSPKPFKTDSLYYLKNIGNGLCFSFRNHDDRIITRPCGLPSLYFQAIKFENLGSEFEISLKDKNGCVDLRGGNNDENGHVQRWHCGPNNESVRYQLFINKDSSITIKTVKGKCLKVENDSSNDGTPVNQNTCDYESLLQRWIPIKITNIDELNRGNYYQSIA